MTDPFERARQRMVQEQLERRGIHDPGVLAAMGALPRERFAARPHAQSPYQVYGDRALPVEGGQTLSQPYMVARMSEALRLTGTHRVLEIGTGTGYQTAVLARLAGEVWTVERDPSLAEGAGRRLDRMKEEGLVAASIHTRTGDGTLGWPEAAPFDAILVTAGAPAIPRSLVDQLADGGLLVIPVGPRDGQELLRIEREGEELAQEVLLECRFVPLTGEEGWGPEGRAPPPRSSTS